MCGVWCPVLAGLDIFIMNVCRTALAREYHLPQVINMINLLIFSPPQYHLAPQLKDPEKNWEGIRKTDHKYEK